MISCCRICGGVLDSWSDRDEGRTLEQEESCPGCGLYAYEFHYGHTEERVGVIVSMWDHDEDGPTDWREREEEAKRIWGNGDAMCLVRAMRDRPNDGTPRLVMADWCDDNELPLSAAYLRGDHDAN